MSKRKEKVNHPSHYNFSKFEVIDIINDWDLNFPLGNVLKYAARAGRKDNEVEDLKKAKFYLTYHICKNQLINRFTPEEVLKEWKLSENLSEFVYYLGYLRELPAEELEETLEAMLEILNKIIEKKEVQEPEKDLC